MAWLAYALLAMLCFASNNFLLSAVGKRAGSESAAEANVTGMIVIWMVAGVSGCTGVLMMGRQTLWDGIKGPANLLLGIVTAVVNVGAMLMLALALASDPDSAGPITAMLPLNSLVVSALCWMCLSEGLGKQEMAGIFIAMLGPMIMSLADMSGSALKGIGLGGLTALGFGCSNFLRKTLAKRGASSGSIVVVLYCSIGACSIAAAIASFILRGGLPGLESALSILFVIASGLLWVTGGLCFQWALVGKAGPASAVTNTNSVGVLVYTIIFFHPKLQALKIVGMAFCIVGVTVLSLKPREAPPPARHFQVDGGDSFVSLHSMAAKPL